MSGAKGLVNALGENNCFLNVIIQTLYHTNGFSEQLLSSHKDHDSCNTECLLCALRIIFISYKEDNTTTIHPNSLRSVLATLDSQYEIGKMNDAAETFDLVLDALHTSLSKNKGEDYESFVSDTFGLKFTQQIKCSQCSSSSSDLIYSTYLYYVPASPLIENTIDQPFGKLLQKICQTETKSCSNCSQPDLPLEVIATSVPKVLVLGVVWPQGKASHSELCGFMSNLRTKFQVSDLFKDVHSSLQAGLNGIVLYYYQHYLSIFYHKEIGEWILFDDRRVRPLYKNWKDVWKYIVKGGLLPFLLLYEVEAYSEVSEEENEIIVEDTIANIRDELEIHEPESKRLKFDDNNNDNDSSIATLMEIFGSEYSTEELRTALNRFDGDISITSSNLLERGRKCFSTHLTPPTTPPRSSSYSQFSSPHTEPLFESFLSRYRRLSSRAYEMDKAKVESIFAGCHFLLLGRNTKQVNRSETIRAIETLGGAITKKYSNAVTHVVVTSDKYNSQIVEKAISSNIHVVKIQYITDCTRKKIRLNEIDFLWKKKQQQSSLVLPVESHNSSVLTQPTPSLITSTTPPCKRTFGKNNANSWKRKS